MKKQRNGRRYRSVYIRTDPKANRIVVTKTITYKDVTIPAGFRSDGMSKAINKFTPRHTRAALIHDYAIESKCIPRKRADKLFYEILRLDGVGWFKAQMYYKAVSLFRIVTFKK